MNIYLLIMIASLQCELIRAARYKNPTQIARVVTEEWCGTNLYCAACDAETLQNEPVNTKVVDLRCLKCSETYQIKGQKHLNLCRVIDGAFFSLLAAVKQNAAPNLLILNYNADWMIRNLFLVPSLFFTASVLERRRPLSPLARRAGWIGCNIVLNNVPVEGKIPLVKDGIIVDPVKVRQNYRDAKKFCSLDWEFRGWTLDVLKVVHKVRSPEFTLQEIYSFETELLSLHPKNRNIRPKIRQQLQVLRDLGVLEFIGRGKYRLRPLEVADC